MIIAGDLAVVAQAAHGAHLGAAQQIIDKAHKGAEIVGDAQGGPRLSEKMEV